MSVIVTYTNAKTAMHKLGYAGVVAGTQWLSTDQAQYRQMAADCAYGAGTPVNYAQANYGFAYPGVMPASVVAKVTAAAAYSATLAASPTTGPNDTTVTFTLTETNGPAQSYYWAFGDGATATTTTNTTTHEYTTAGAATLTITCTPTVDGVVETPVTTTFTKTS